MALVLHTPGCLAYSQCSSMSRPQLSSSRCRFSSMFTLLKSSLAGDIRRENLRNWKGSAALPHAGSRSSSVASLCSLSVDIRSNPNESSSGRKAKCLCKLLNGNTAGERAFDDDRENCDGEGGTSWLHYLMHQAGIDISHAQAARRNYAEEVANLRTEIVNDAESSRSVNLARAALEIAAEDDALVSHSPVPLPVDAYLDRLQAMALEFAGHYLPPQCDSPDNVLEALDLYLFGYQLEEYMGLRLWNLDLMINSTTILTTCAEVAQGFRRTKSLHNTVDARVFYLNTVLTTRLGTPVMLALIYSELVKRLQHMGVIDFSVDMELSGNLNDLPRPRLATQDVSKSRDEHSVLFTPELLLVEVLRSLKQLYWPWRENGTIGEGSGFLQAATAASRGFGMTASSSAFDSLFHAPHSSGGAELARARSAQLRLQRGIWTSTNFGDLRRALAASERLVLLGVDDQELRDYGMLLFHAGLYGRSFEYLNAYSETLKNNVPSSAPNTLKMKEDMALERLLERLRLILAEQAWLGTSGTPFTSSELPPDPW